MEPVFLARCTGCHGSDRTDGNYDLSSYLGALGTGSDSERNAVAGDASSLLLTVLNPSTADDQHRPFTDLYPLVREWVVECALAYANIAAHGGGILNPDDPEEFHGAVLRASDWAFDECAGCHGADFSGGIVGAPCTTCHEDGPTACETCHRPGDQSGAHAAHLEAGALDKSYRCAECHVEPRSYLAPGHLFGADGSVDAPPAEVVFGSLARRSVNGGEREGPPHFDPDTKTCTNVYCHGDAFGDATATNTEPVWSDGPPGQAACGTCHGLAPSSHQSDQCSLCHGNIASDAPDILDPARHLDGAIDAIGQSCDGCHGSGESGAPPPDLNGNVDPSVVGVGAHASHVEAPSRISAPIPCTDCHLVPAMLLAPGHVDEDGVAEVFPQTPGFASRALARGATPRWDRATATCQDVHCHGGGPAQKGDLAPGIIRAPEWTNVGGGQASCGACHGLPPTTGFHNASMTLEQCHLCHPATVSEGGEVIVTGAPGQESSAHVNGIVDAF